MDSSVWLEDRIWFLRVCHHIPFSLYTQQWYVSYKLQLQLASRIRTEFRPDPARKLSANLYDIYHCCVYSEKQLMMDRGTVRTM